MGRYKTDSTKAIEKDLSDLATGGLVPRGTFTMLAKKYQLTRARINNIAKSINISAKG